nr:WbuC family cupin fold metalloprotein [Aurantimonas sp. CSK15Z-1]
MTEVAPGIFYGREPLVVADDRLVGFLKAQARANAVRRARLCAHPAADAFQHDMLIVSHRDTYVAPHRHRSKSESFVVIEGEAEVFVFEEDGSVSERFVMGAAASGLPFFYRMPTGRYHSLLIRSELLVFVESTIGPFVKSDMEEAPWAPPASDAAAGRAYLSGLGN